MHAFVAVAKENASGTSSTKSEWQNLHVSLVSMWKQSDDKRYDTTYFPDCLIPALDEYLFSLRSRKKKTKRRKADTQSKVNIVTIACDP